MSLKRLFCPIFTQKHINSYCKGTEEKAYQQLQKVFDEQQNIYTEIRTAAMHVEDDLRERLNIDTFVTEIKTELQKHSDVLENDVEQSIEKVANHRNNIIKELDTYKTNAKKELKGELNVDVFMVDFEREIKQSIEKLANHRNNIIKELELSKTNAQKELKEELDIATFLTDFENKIARQSSLFMNEIEETVIGLKKQKNNIIDELEQYKIEYDADKENYNKDKNEVTTILEQNIKQTEELFKECESELKEKTEMHIERLTESTKMINDKMEGFSLSLNQNKNTRRDSERELKKNIENQKKIILEARKDSERYLKNKVDIFLEDIENNSKKLEINLSQQYKEKQNEIDGYIQEIHSKQASVFNQLEKRKKTIGDDIKKSIKSEDFISKFKEEAKAQLGSIEEEIASSFSELSKYKSKVHEEVKEAKEYFLEEVKLSKSKIKEYRFQFITFSDDLKKYQDDITKHQNQITASKEDFGEVIKEQSKELKLEIQGMMEKFIERKKGLDDKFHELQEEFASKQENAEKELGRASKEVLSQQNELHKQSERLQAQQAKLRKDFQNDLENTKEKYTEVSQKHHSMVEKNFENYIEKQEGAYNELHQAAANIERDLQSRLNINSFILDLLSFTSSKKYSLASFTSS